ncbi:MAG: TfoX/Sxy family protein [Xanthomonadales bacterium]|nr:TfoX/Sxy family protein [Xanthomonadales bacterium]
MGRDYLDYLHDLFSAFAPVTTRAMFGGHGVYRDGVIIGIVIDEAIYLKVDGETRGAFEAAGSEPFVYEAKGKRVPMSYWTVPEEALDSPQEFRPWAQRAWEAALRKPKPKPRKSAAKKTVKPKAR